MAPGHPLERIVMEGPIKVDSTQIIPMESGRARFHEVRVYTPGGKLKKVISEAALLKRHKKGYESPDFMDSTTDKICVVCGKEFKGLKDRKRCTACINGRKMKPQKGPQNIKCADCKKPITVKTLQIARCRPCQDLRTKTRREERRQQLKKENKS